MTDTNQRPVLVVDDSMFQRRLVRQALKGEDYSLVEANNGVTAIEAIDTQ